MPIVSYTERMKEIEEADQSAISVKLNMPLVRYIRSNKGKQHLMEAFRKDKTTRIAQHMVTRDPILVLRAYFKPTSFCEMMLPYSVNKDLQPTAPKYVNPTAEAFRQFRIEAKI